MNSEFSKKLKSYDPNKLSRGELLLEILFVIAVSAIILSMSATLLVAGLTASKVSIERDTVLALTEETLTAVRAASSAEWQLVSGLSVGSANKYFPEIDATSGRSYKWVDHATGALWGANSVNAVSAFSPGEVWIGIDNGAGSGAVYRWDGKNWEVKTPGTAFSVRDIATVTDSEIWVVGNSGNVWRYNGLAWTQHSGSGRWGTANITAVSAANSSNVWIAGASGNVWHYNGSTWTDHSSGGWSSVAINSISALSNQAWLAGDGGVVYRYNGSTWTGHSGGWGSANLNEISFASTSNVWLAGAAGVVYRYNGTTWAQEDGSGFWDTANVANVSAFDTDHVFISAGTELWSYNGVTWSEFPNVDSWGINSILDISDRFSTELFVVGASGSAWGFKPAAWKLTAVSGGNDGIEINGLTYTRNFYVDAVQRDGSGNIVSSGGTVDPSTLKVTAEVTWGGNTTTSSDYISRWGNDSCHQTQWSNSGNTDVHINCPTTDYGSESNVDFLFSDTSLAILLPLVNPDATLTSTVFDTTRLSGTGLGPVYRFIYWTGSMANSANVVSFQIATADSPTPASWDYYGGSPCVPGGWFSWTSTTGAVSDAQEIDCPSLDDNRYFRYRVELQRGVAGSTPRVDDITITWSP